MPTSPAACLIFVEFIPPSVRHVPCLLPVHGVSATRALVYRLRACFADRCTYVVLSAAEGATADRLAAEAAQAGATFVRTRMLGVAAAIEELCGASPHLRAALLFPANAVVPNCLLAESMLAETMRAETIPAGTVPTGTEPAGSMLAAPPSRDAGPEVTISFDVPIGLGPALTLRTSAASWLASLAPRAGTCQELTAAVAAAAGQPAHASRIRTQRAAGPLAVPLDTLPAAALIIDEPTRLAAEAALTECPARCGWEPAQAFKRALIRTTAEPRPMRRTASSTIAPGAIDASRSRTARTVLFSSLQPAFSGGEESLGTLIANLDRDQFSPVAVFPLPTMLADKLERRGVPVEIAGRDYTTLHPASLDYCARLIDEHAPSVVHVDGFVNPALMITARTRGIPIVGHLRVLAGPSLPPSALLADRIITVSDAVARDARRNTIDPRRIVRIYNGVDGTRLDVAVGTRAQIRQRRQIPEDARVIAMIARITPFKRLDLLIEALPAIVRAIPDAQVLFVGEPFPQDREHHAALRAAVRSAGLDPHVTWWGFEPEIGQVYAAADLLVHANRHEPLARCLIEGLACGLPLVGPRDGGTVEVIDDGRNGLLYEPDSASALADAVIAILGDDATRARMAHESRQSAAAFSVQRHVTQVQALYRELLEERAAAAAPPEALAATSNGPAIRPVQTVVGKGARSC